MNPVDSTQADYSAILTVTRIAWAGCYTMHLSKLALSACGLLVLTACNTVTDTTDNVRAPVYKGATGENVAKITVTSINQLRWADMRRDLAAVKIALSQEQLFQKGFVVTSSGSSILTDRGADGLSATLSGPTFTKQNGSSVDATGATTRTSSRTEGFATPSQPAAPAGLGAPGAFPATTGFSSDIDTSTRAQMAAAVAQSFVEMGRRYDGVPIQEGYVPIYVDLLVSVDPLNRYQPYDTTITLDFCHNPEKNSNIKPDECAGDPFYVIPMTSTEVLEGSQRSTAQDFARQLAAQIGASSHGLALTASTQRLLEDMVQQQFVQLNSLSLPIQNGSNGLAVRFGANRVGNHYEMAARTHSVTLILLMPRQYLRPGSPNREVAIKVSAYYRDPDVAENASISKTHLGYHMQPSVFPVDPIPFPVCPSAPNLVAQIVPATVPNLGSMMVLVSGATGLDYRPLQASLETPALKDGKTMTIMSTDFARSAAGLQFTFPDVSKYMKPLKADGVARGSLRLVAPDDREGPLLICPNPRSAYEVVFPVSATPKAEAKKDDKPATAATPRWVLSEVAATTAK